MFWHTNDYIKYLLEDKKISNNTVVAYQRDLDNLVQYFSEHNVYEPEHVTYTTLNAYILWLENKHLSSASVSRNISTIKSYFNYLFYERIIDKNPAINIKAPKINKKIPEILTIEEMEELLSMPDCELPLGIRDKAMLELLYATGMKVSELISLKTKDVSLIMKTVTIVDEYKGRLVPFGNSAAEAIKIYLEKIRPNLSKENDFLFVNKNGEGMTRQGFWKIVKKYGKDCNIEDRLSPHIFRNSFAAHLIMNGADLKSLQEIMGHADITTTQIYANFSKNGVHSVYDKAHPRK